MEKIQLLIGISELIARDMSGQLNHTEKKTLVRWLESAECNKKIYTKIIEGHNLSERNRIYESVDVEQGWGEISESLTGSCKKRIVGRIMKYAAIILLPIAIGITTYWFINDQPAQPSKTMAGIQPGSANAVLVLADGENIDLSNDIAQSLVEEDGTMIVNRKDELSYVGSGKNQRKVLFNTLIVPKGGEYNLVLSDGSRVLVNSMSKLIFPVRFSGNIRELSLEEGEAYFEVTKDQSKPFIVKVKGVRVEVLGTSFNIKAYADDQHLYTTLVEGQVKLSTDTQSSKAFFLMPDQQAVYDSESAGITIQKVDAKQIVQWTTGRYSFTNQTLNEIMKTLSRWYDFDYRYEDEALKQIRFEGGLNKYESISPILDIISGTGKVKVEVRGKEVLFRKDKK